MKKRITVIVLDSFGIGAAPDAEAFGDCGASTIGSLIKTGKLNIPNLISLGLGNIDGVDGLARTEKPKAAHGRLVELSRGKDTTVGHWELAGVISESAMPTYKNGFPKEIIDLFKEKTNRGVLCNKPYSGTDVIRDFGDEHVKSGDLIVYTSEDSVFQIAAHEDVVPCDKLYEYCKTARSILTGEHAVGRVIARPFVGESGNYKRTPNRRDFSLEPHGETMLDAIKAKGLDVIGVGKIGDIFAGRGLTESYPTHGNNEGMEITKKLLSRDFTGLLFVNLVDFDSLYGHRQDADGYAAAISEFDRRLGEILPLIGNDDMLIITADHGCDPSDKSTDHTREYVPFLCYGDGIEPQNLGTLKGFYNVADTVLNALGISFEK